MLEKYWFSNYAYSVLPEYIKWSILILLCTYIHVCLVYVNIRVKFKGWFTFNAKVSFGVVFQGYVGHTRASFHGTHDTNLFVHQQKFTITSGILLLSLLLVKLLLKWHDCSKTVHTQL